jgi:hypothetical protein
MSISKHKYAKVSNAFGLALPLYGIARNVHITLYEIITWLESHSLIASANQFPRNVLCHEVDMIGVSKLQIMRAFPMFPRLNWIQSVLDFRQHANHTVIEGLQNIAFNFFS